MSLVALMWPHVVEAQLAPTGGHYAGRASDTGHSPGMVSASGGYSASVPLDLPEARGGLPVPLQITSGSHGVGAAGQGWDVPLSYIRRDDTFARRRPAFGDNTLPQPRVQVSLSLQGRTLDLVPKGSTWVARYDAPELSLREQGGTWVMYDGQGLTYTFVAPPELAGTGLWLLSTITGPAGTAVQLDYDIGAPVLQGGSGLSIDLRRIRYNKHPTTSCYKHEVTLGYDAVAASPLSLSVLGDRVLARLRTVTAVDVWSRAGCTDSAERLRRYELAYLPDADTRQPRLASVRLFGRQGTPEQSVPLPVVSFGYGSATPTGKLQYQKTQTLALPTGAATSGISSTTADGSVVPPIEAGVGYSTWQSLTDVTGDGRPDLVFQKDGKLWLGLNRPSVGGTTTLGAWGAVAQLADATFSSGPFEARSATNNRFTYSANYVNVDKVWRQAIDINGDGRVDVIDAADTPGQWVIYLNTPGTGASGITWARRTYSIARLYNHLRIRGHSVDSNWIPLASRFTGRDYTTNACWRFNGMDWVSYPEGWAIGRCFGTPNELLSTGSEKTYTEWELTDVNGDGYADVVLNSSRVDLVSMGGPQWSGALNDIVGGPHTMKVQPLQGDANNVDAMLNLRGPFLDESLNVFSTPISPPLQQNTACGVGLWGTSTNTQVVICGLADVNGDGLLDRVENQTTVSLGTGHEFLPVTMTLPGPFAVQQSGQTAACVDPVPDPPGTTRFGAGQRGGLRDLTGDGIPDYVDKRTGFWRVAIGTGAGFAPLIDIDAAGAGFSFSNEDERCDGKSSDTVSGLYDIDGDGRPEVVRLNGANLDVFQLAGGSLPGIPEAGKLVQVDNGYGAKTRIGYRSAKEDGTTLHQVPFPEIVVTSVATTGSLGLGGSLLGTRYAYGGAELIYDSSLHAFTMPGYQRSVELTTLAPQAGRTEGRATLTDTYPLAPFAPTPKNERFGRYLRAGKVRDITVLRGPLDSDPWMLLATDVATDPRRISGTHFEWATRLIEEPAIPGTETLDCLEMMFPLDFVTSFFSNGTGWYNVCSAHGFVFGTATDSWRGHAAPPSTANVATRSEVRAVDDYGRVLSVMHRKDRHRNDDDLCVDTAYASPVGPNEQVLFAPSSRRYWDCNKENFPTYASESWTYDDLSPGSVSVGRVTSHSLDRRATSTGALLNTVRAYDARYDAAGNPSTITRKREDGAVRTVNLEYDPFGLAAMREKVDAFGLPSIDSTVTRDALTLAVLSTTDAHKTQYGTEFDGYGRQVRSTVTPAGGQHGVLATLSYLGFSGADPLGRRLVSKSFTDPVKPGSEASASGRVGTTYLDELGRGRRTELALGKDYADETMVTGARTYDGLGRVFFEADPFPSQQEAASAYGTSHYFQPDGSPLCSIRGHGPQLLTTVPDEANERYPTCYSRSFLDHQETLSVSDAASMVTSSAQAGVTSTATLTAVGRVLSRSTWKGALRLEHATFTHDRVGQLTGMTRYLDASGATNPVQWSWSLDSFGQLLEWQEPESALQVATYSTWGELLEVKWTDTTASPTANRVVTSRYDALGRVTHREERTNGTLDKDTVNDFTYDVGSSPTSLVTPTFVLGRLAKIKAATGEIFYSYDAYGRPDTRTFTSDQGVPYVEKSKRHADGSLATLEFYLPDTGFRREWVDYGYDSASRLRSIRFEDGSIDQELYSATEIDPFGRVRKASYGGTASYDASYADVGRRLMNEVSVASAHGSRRLMYMDYDPLGREKVQREIKNGAVTGPKTNLGYDALGRLSYAHRTDGPSTLFSWAYGYDPLGNVLGLTDLAATGDAALSYRTVDRDRICRVGYGNGGLGGTACNVLHDGLGNVVEQPTRTGLRKLSYYPSGQVKSISEQSTVANFRYGAGGAVQEFEVTGAGAVDARHDWRYGGLIERRDQTIGGQATSVITRQIPGPGGLVASRRGAGKDWVFQFGEGRGLRFSTDANGAFMQDLDYQPFGEAASTGVPPSSLSYSSAQWNGGEAIAAFGLSYLGARVYDPVIGRFLSRDPLTVPRTAATSNPYAFAMNDPRNLSDPSGLDPGCIGKECQGPTGGGFPGGGGGPSGINSPGLYLRTSGPSAGANPQTGYRPPTPSSFSGTPKGPQTAAGRALREAVVDSGEVMLLSTSFNFDRLAAMGMSVRQVLDRLAETPESQIANAEHDASLDASSSFFAGLGDTVWFWCPGCSKNMRQSWGIKSGDADGRAYRYGSLTGFVGSIATPRPTSIIAPPPPTTDVGPKLIFTLKNDPSTISVHKVPGVPGYTDLVIHGNGQSFSIAQTTVPLSPQIVAQMILRNRGYPGGAIRLLSCSSGACGATAAQKLANAMGVEVLGATDDVWINVHGQLSVGPTEFIQTGGWRSFFPQVP